jgi:hypothetical protein
MEDRPHLNRVGRGSQLAPRTLTRRRDREASESRREPHIEVLYALRSRKTGFSPMSERVSGSNLRPRVANPSRPSRPIYFVLNLLKL